MAIAWLKSRVLIGIDQSATELSALSGKVLSSIRVRYSESLPFPQTLRLTLTLTLTLTHRPRMRILRILKNSRIFMYFKTANEF